MVFSGTRMLRPLSNGVSLLGAMTLTLSMLMPTTGGASRVVHATLTSDELGRTTDTEGSGLVSICCRVCNSCSTRRPQPTADDSGPDIPARVTTAVKKNMYEVELEMNSCDASLALPVPAEIAMTNPIHTAKLHFTPRRNVLDARSSQNCWRMQLRAAASTVLNVLDMAFRSRRWPA